MAGGWQQAGRLPALQALKWLEETFSHRKNEAYARSLDRWYSALPAYRGGEPPEPPEAPED